MDPVTTRQPPPGSPSVIDRMLEAVRPRSVLEQPLPPDLAAEYQARQQADAAAALAQQQAAEREQLSTAPWELERRRAEAAYLDTRNSPSLTPSGPAPEPTFRDRIHDFLAEKVGSPTAAEHRQAAESARASNAVAMGAGRPGGPGYSEAQEAARLTVGGMSQIPVAAAQGAAESASFGLARPIVPEELQSTAAGIARGAGQLAGFVAGPALVGKLLSSASGLGELLATPQGAEFGTRLAFEAAQQAARMGISSGLAQTGSAALDAHTTLEGLKTVAGAVQSGALTGAMFGLADRLRPDPTLTQWLERFVGTSLAQDLMTGNRPWDDRPAQQKAYDYLLNLYFTRKGAGSTSEAPDAYEVARQKGFVVEQPPTTFDSASVQRIKTLKAFVDLASQYGLDPKAVTAARDAAAKLPQAQVGPFLARFATAASRRGLSAPVDPHALDALAGGPVATKPGKTAAAPTEGAAATPEAQEAPERPDPLGSSKSQRTGGSTRVPAPAPAAPRVIALAGRDPGKAEPLELRPTPQGAWEVWFGGRALRSPAGGPVFLLPRGVNDLEAKQSIRKARLLPPAVNFYPAESTQARNPAGLQIATPREARDDVSNSSGEGREVRTVRQVAVAAAPYSRTTQTVTAAQPPDQGQAQDTQPKAAGPEETPQGLSQPALGFKAIPRGKPGRLLDFDPVVGGDEISGTFEIRPARYLPGKVAVQAPPVDGGTRSRAGRLAQHFSGGTVGGVDPVHIMSPRTAERFQRALADGSDASPQTGRLIPPPASGIPTDPLPTDAAPGQRRSKTPQEVAQVQLRTRLSLLNSLRECLHG